MRSVSTARLQEPSPSARKTALVATLPKHLPAVMPNQTVTPSVEEYERLARVLAGALATWWRKTHPHDPELRRWELSEEHDRQGAGGIDIRSAESRRASAPSAHEEAA